MDESPPKKSGYTTGLIIGLAVGLGASCFLGVVAAGAGYYQIERARKRARAGWNLVPVIVANQDIAAGTPLSFDMISQRSVPEQFVTSSVVKPDSASYVVGQKITVPAQAGDLLLWSQFETGKKDAPGDPRNGPIKKYREANPDSAE
jgi:Flp pilus assembly protein CpaB